eukprot:COSAG01_NODE_3499_length_6004_cov_2.645047_8_plen_93_part_00
MVAAAAPPCHLACSEGTKKTGSAAALRCVPADPSLPACVATTPAAAASSWFPGSSLGARNVTVCQKHVLRFRSHDEDDDDDEGEEVSAVCDL